MGTTTVVDRRIPAHPAVSRLAYLSAEFAGRDRRRRLDVMGRIVPLATGFHLGGVTHPLTGLGGLADVVGDVAWVVPFSRTIRTDRLSERGI